MLIIINAFTNLKSILKRKTIKSDLDRYKYKIINFFFYLY